MRFFKILLLNIFFISVAINAFGMDKTDSNINEAFQYLKIACQINFSDSDKKIVEQLFGASKSNNASVVDKIIASLNEKTDADKSVCMTLFLFVYDSSENLAKEFLAQKKFKNFIFKALSSQEANDAYRILHKMIEVCTNVGLFLFLEEFINQILLESFEKDEDKSMLTDIIDFVVDCESFFKEALEKIADNPGYKTLKISINKLLDQISDNFDSDYTEEENDEDLSGSDIDDLNGASDSGECSSDEDSDGECAHTRGWNDHISYTYEHMDQLN